MINQFNKFIYMLAPIEDMTSAAFRSLCHQYGADLTFTELTRVEGLIRNNKSTLSRIELYDNTPTVIQLLGAKEEYFRKFLKEFKPKYGFNGFNLNMGCPSPSVIKIGQGCALIKRIKKTQGLIKVFRDYNYPISIKIRVGLNQYEKEKKTYINLIESVDVDYFIVHARHGMQSYNEPADFSVYEACVKTGKVIIANGDIKTKEQIDYLKSIGVKGAMIGRAAISDPLIFNRLKEAKAIKPNIEEIIKEYLILAEKYIEKERYRRNILKLIKR